MEIFRKIEQTKDALKKLRTGGGSIGFVPTMGALHKGHLDLVSLARQENDFVVCSIFVNPIQFNNPSDLVKYPRTFERDVELLRSAGCDLLFYPDTLEMYPQPETKVYDFGQLDIVMEGKFRPGHFNGVAIVVKKLFDIVEPERAYFGEKDFQQLAIIKALVKIEHIKVDVVSCPTTREPDGLAMSSRNMRLSPEQREKAPVIFQTLVKAGEIYREKGPGIARRWVKHIFENEPLANLEYFEIADLVSLEPVEDHTIKDEVVGCIAVCFGDVRLIDNMIFKL
jgi:pantoate--beta-alanine ligase